MHELKAINNVISQLRKSGIKNGKVKILLGKMVADKNVFLDMFKEFVKGTELENISLDIIESPVKIRCICGFCGNVEIKEHIHFVRCPECNRIAEILEGNEIKIIY